MNTPVKTLEDTIKHLEELSELFISNIERLSADKKKYGNLLPFQERLLNDEIVRQKLLTNIYGFIYDLPIRLVSESEIRNEINKIYEEY